LLRPSELLDAGAKILQFRHKTVFSGDVFAELQAIAELCAQAQALLVVNDRADIARMVRAALHLGQDDLLPAQARCVLGDDALIGLLDSQRGATQAARSEPADYLAIGPIFGTLTKANPDPKLVSKPCGFYVRLTDRPLVAIGGITRANARSVLDAGADSVAVIGDLFPDVKARAREFLAVTSL